MQFSNSVNVSVESRRCRLAAHVYHTGPLHVVEQYALSAAHCTAVTLGGERT